MEPNMDTSDPLFSSSGLDFVSSGLTNEWSNDSFNLNNYNPSTPDLNTSTGWTDRRSLSVPREDYETFQSELERTGQLKHNSWLRNRETLPCSKDASETKEKNKVLNSNLKIFSCKLSQMLTS